MDDDIQLLPPDKESVDEEDAVTCRESGVDVPSVCEHARPSNGLGEDRG